MTAKKGLIISFWGYRSATFAGYFLKYKRPGAIIGGTAKSLPIY
jgi:hypothetical protein